jgi:hypothetical protein
MSLPALSNSSIIVLGMHRSGTSATGGVFNLLGIDFGNSLYQAQRDVNEKGFWEHGPIVDCHDELLLTLGSSWDDPRPLPEGWQERPDVELYFRRLMNIASTDFQKSPIWGLKDPRMCRLMPLWHKIFVALQIKPFYVIMIRNPLEVAASLGKRNGFSLEKSLFLWWQHQALAELETRGAPRIFVAYQDLLNQPEDTLRRVSDCFNLPWPKPLSGVMPAITNFLTPSLRHHKNLVFEGRSRIEIEVEAAYRAYLLAASPSNMGEPQGLAEHSEAFMAHFRSLSPMLLEHMATMAEESRLARLTLQQYYDCFAVKVAKRICMLEKYIASLFGSRS